MSKMKARFTVQAFGLICLAVGLAACGGTSKGAADSTTSYYVISKQEIEAAVEKKPMQNAYEIIEFLRPKYLSPRTQSSISRGVIQAEPVVYLNNARFGTINELYNISYEQITEIKYLKGREANHRFGFGHEGGAILISTL
ncbi:MAG: hypothetical protein H6695_02975 [Deferribacteres bacterium]|nr:hypothetical protein [candidate division KSB1 bacterium]MCB9509110.1 hypothetical protein [Deferribacteres bacterium]